MDKKKPTKQKQKTFASAYDFSTLNRCYRFIFDGCALARFYICPLLYSND